MLLHLCLSQARLFTQNCSSLVACLTDTAQKNFLDAYHALADGLAIHVVSRASASSLKTKIATLSV